MASCLEIGDFSHSSGIQIAAIDCKPRLIYRMGCKKIEQKGPNIMVLNAFNNLSVKNCVAHNQKIVRFSVTIANFFPLHCVVEFVHL